MASTPKPAAADAPKAEAPPADPPPPAAAAAAAPPPAAAASPPADPPPPDDEDSVRGPVNREGLAKGLAAVAKEFKCSGHALLAKVSSLGKGPVEQAAHDLAFAANTGLAPAAIQGLRGLTPKAMAELLGDVVDGQLDQDGVTALLRERFPEPKRPGVAQA